MKTVRSVGEIVEALPDPATLGTRFIVAVAGPPGAGKSTLADALRDALEASAPGRSAVVPMDGFHYDNAVIEPAGLKARKGAPETFDTGGYHALLQRLKQDDEATVAVPVFDRTLDLARAGARLIGTEQRMLIAEGNYLLLDDAQWTDLQPLFDLTVFLDVPMPVLRERLIDRWRHHGLDEAAAVARAEGNDLTNARLVVTRSAAATLRLVQD